MTSASPFPSESLLIEVSNLVNQYERGDFKNLPEPEGLLGEGSLRCFDKNSKDTWLHKAILVCESPNDTEIKSKLEVCTQEDMDQCNGEGFTPIHLSCTLRLPEWTKTLIDMGASLECKTIPRKSRVSSFPSYELGGNTPLHLAFESGDLESVELLLAAMADTRAKNDAGLIPEHMLLLSNSVGERYKHYMTSVDRERVREEVENRVKEHKKLLDVMEGVLTYLKIKLPTRQFVDTFYLNYSSSTTRTRTTFFGVGSECQLCRCQGQWGSCVLL
ncbi:hypothetical protein AAMO2058_000281600 [Amorphochlora amoebiformis]